MLTSILLTGFAAALPQGGSETSITIYGSSQPGSVNPDLYRQGASPYGAYGPQQIPGYAMVRQDRSMELTTGRNTIRFTDVAALIDPTTVSFASITDPAGTRVLEQNFEYDLVNNARLLERFLDKEVTLEYTSGSQTMGETGTLLNAQNGFVLRKPDGSLRLLTHYTRFSLPNLPGGLITRPTLVWDLDASQAGIHKTRVSYQTNGITWWADYNVVYSEGKNANQGILDIGAWVSILNQSGGEYKNAKLKLVAGDVHRVQPEELRYGWASKSSVADRSGVAGGFVQKSFFEYHLYTLGRLTTIPDRSTKQVDLFAPAKSIPCDKVLVYYGLDAQFRGFQGDVNMDRSFGSQGNKKVDVYLRFKNSKDTGLGMPLPAGRIRVSKVDPDDQSLEFVGEDAIDHTPKDESVLVKMGSAFDVVGERRQLDFRLDTNRKFMEEDIEVKVRNHKEEPVEVLVKENLYRWVQWSIIKKSHDFQKTDSRTIQFPLTIDKDGEAVVRYTVRYTW
jgi:hypothetical protein